ncbi:MAG: hypothetical protein CK529_13690 [Rhodospirillaceae bacterium]|nr:MAG: hypothetical protein CK529_13690 [Rhodospirillaceae bacterium]
MPRSASTGVYTAPSNSFNPALTNTIISATAWNATQADTVTALAHAASTTRALYPTTAQVQDGGLIYGGTAGGTANALTLTLSPAITVYSTGIMIQFITGASPNTGAATMNVNGVGVQNLRHRNGLTELAAHNIAAGASYTIIYDGTLFRLLNPDLIVGAGAQIYTALNFGGF